MADSTFPAALAFTLSQEGGWSDNPGDPGGATMKGVTYVTFLTHFPGASLDDLRNITDVECTTIYHSYWDEVDGDRLAAGPDLSVFDMAVNAGPWRSIELLQQALGIAVDGEIGPVTLTACAKASPSEVIAALAGAQKAYYESLSGFVEFGRGWINRVEARAKAALQVIPKSAPKVP